MTCNFCCGASAELREFAITVDGVPLRVRPRLCSDCGDRFLIKAGELIGEMARQSGSAAAPAADRPRCARCKEFLSATRIEMRIDRCAKCDGARGKAQR